MTADTILLEVEHLKKYFPVRKGLFRRKTALVKAVDDVDMFIKKGETLGLVGESGCGKTTVGRTILRLIEPTDGKIFFRSRQSTETDAPLGKTDVAAASDTALKVLRRDMHIIFQDPYSSLDPRMTVARIIGEPLFAHRLANKSEREDRVRQLLESVGLGSDHLRRYPHEFSGGQRQRIGIARALALEPQLIIADEPVSALDVSIQAQVLNLLLDLQDRFGLTYLFIGHDLSVVKYMSDRVAVMYLGKIVELAESGKLFAAPKHPYTEALMSAVPVPDPKTVMKRIILQGDVPSPVNPPAGCYFHPRCRYCEPVCRKEPPVYRDLGDNHFAACHFADSLALHNTQMK